MRIVCGIAGLLLAVAGWSQATRTVEVTAVDRSYKDVIVSAVMTPPPGTLAASVRLGRTVYPAQLEREGSKARVYWRVRDLARGEKRTFTVHFSKQPPKDVRFRVVREDGNVELRFDQTLFARYDVTTGPNKPYFHPIFAPGGKLAVRGFPVAPRPGETSDHKHHRGLWFTHGSVNGEDFWAETENKTVHRGYRAFRMGPLLCGFTADTDWVAKDGRLVAKDTRDVRACVLDGQYVMDVEITLRPASGPIVLGDTKEGTFAIRLPDSMRVKGGDGTILTSEGLRDAAAWGKRAAWVDYSGTADGARIGVAIFDHPTSFRHPTYWHVRDYGLFAANPFGIHDFEPGQPAETGNHTVPPGGAVAFRYRLVFHTGDAAEARIADLYGEYAAPPRVTVK